MEMKREERRAFAFARVRVEHKKSTETQIAWVSPNKEDARKTKNKKKIIEAENINKRKQNEPSKRAAEISTRDEVKRERESE